MQDSINIMSLTIVSNTPRSEEVLRSFFEPFGTIKSIGPNHVEFTTRRSAKNAIQSRQLEFYGFTVCWNIEEWKNKDAMTLQFECDNYAEFDQLYERVSRGAYSVTLTSDPPINVKIDTSTFYIDIIRKIYRQIPHHKITALFSYESVADGAYALAKAARQPEFIKCII